MTKSETFERHGHTWTVEYSEPARGSKDAEALIASVQARGKKQLMAFVRGKNGLQPLAWNSPMLTDGAAFRKKRDSLMESVESFEDYLEGLRDHEY